MATVNRKARRETSRSQAQAAEEAKSAAAKRAKIVKVGHSSWEIRSGKHLFGTESTMNAAIARRRQVRA